MRTGSFIQDDQNNPEMGFSQCLQYKMQFYWLDYKIFVGSLAAIKFHPFDQQYPKAHCLSRCWEILLWTCRKDWWFFFLQSVSLEEFRLGLLFKRIYLGDGPKSRQRELKTNFRNLLSKNWTNTVFQAAYRFTVYSMWCCRNGNLGWLIPF